MLSFACSVLTCFNIGSFIIVFLLFKIIYGMYNFYVTFFTDSSLDLKKIGKWAIVTGSTDGIGKAIAEELAKRHINIFLISRNPEKLKTVAKYIENRYNVETRTVALDFRDFDATVDNPQPYDVIYDIAQSLEIGILVNNVGMSAVLKKEFLEAHKNDQTSTKSLTDLIHCNSSSRPKMIEIFLPGMVQRNRGLIINISSMAASLMCPMLSTYSATKRFDDTLSLSLSKEYCKSGVIIQSIAPGIVQTNMTKDKIKKPSLLAPDPTTYVKHMMKTIGKSDITTGYWVHAVIRWCYFCLPESLVPILALRRLKSIERNVT